MRAGLSAPLSGNPITSRGDFEAALRTLIAPLPPLFSTGYTRLPLDGTGAKFDESVVGLEGYARVLWGLAPWGAAAGDAIWEQWREGLANGTNPAHPGYWGAPRDRDQRLVEAAAIGFALALVPDLLWEPLPPSAKECAARWLLSAYAAESETSNWLFFRVLVGLGLKRCGISASRLIADQHLKRLDGLHLGNGWYRDGQTRRMDHYIAFAFHFYGLIYAALTDDESRAATYRERATHFAEDYRHWFDNEGGVLIFGRSLTYRFAPSAFWGALAFAGVEALPWGETKRLALSPLRWWRDRPMAHRDGVLSVGHAYPNRMIGENYNSSSSPYWALKAFLPLALGEDHSFWRAAESSPPAPLAEPTAMPAPGIVIMSSGRHITALSSGQHYSTINHGAEKYAKFAYSSRYGFSVDTDAPDLKQANLDSILGLSAPGRHFSVRRKCDVALIAGTTLYSRWFPWEDVTVETWLIPAGLWHIRIHRISTPIALVSAEGGFPIARPDEPGYTIREKRGEATARTETDVSIVIDLLGRRSGQVLVAPPNTNLVNPRTLVPQLHGAIPVGTSILMGAFLASPADDLPGDALPPPKTPQLAAVEHLMETRGQPVGVVGADRPTDVANLRSIVAKTPLEPALIYLYRKASRLLRRR